MQTFELVPTNGRKSFNRKARVVNNGVTLQLYSYDTLVASYNTIDNSFSGFGLKQYSKTTDIHIREFEKFCLGF